ncbi:MAG: zinc-ribbon domain-containing protein [Deltaproteobacteria bacterium]|nr:zinc-ribbon domain-containing protein [Deltaproteobacteria bacterium]
MSRTHNLRVVNPALSKEWHPTKNGTLTPRDVAPNSHKKTWWICDKGHEWQAKVQSRNKGSGCPYCAGRAVCIDNCLQTINPDLAKEWHPKKNGSLLVRQCAVTIVYGRSTSTSPDNGTRKRMGA